MRGKSKLPLLKGQKSLVLWVSGPVIGALLLLAVLRPLSPPTVTVDGSQIRQTVHGIGCYFSNLSLNPAVQRAVLDDLRLRTFRYPMFLQWEQAGGEFAARDNADPEQFNWDHYQRMFAKSHEVASLQERPDWFTGLQWLAAHSERVLVSAWTFWEMSQEIPHLAGLPEDIRDAQVAEDYAAVFLHARDAYGVDLSKVFFSINEPDVKGHNGKVLSAEEHHHLLQAIAHKFTKEGLDAIRFAPPDVGSGRLVRTYLSPLLADPFLKPRIAAASYHLYGKGPEEAVSWTNSQQLEAWMTEFWLDKEGVDLHIFTELRSGASWYVGFASDRVLFPDGTRTFAYYTLKQFCRFIDFPSRYLASSANTSQLQVAAFQHPADGRLGVVIANTGEATTVELAFRNVRIPAQVDAYQTGGGKWASALGPLPVAQGKVSFYAPARSLTTLVSTPANGNDAPVAIIQPGEDQSVAVGAPIAFHAGYSLDNDGDPLSYRWDFADGTLSGETDPVHTFAQAGTARVMLTVTDDKGAQSAAAALVTVEEHSPSAPPSLAIVSPSSDQIVDTTATISWTDDDPDSDARITWFYAIDNNGSHGARICSLFYEDFESDNLDHWYPSNTRWHIVDDPDRPGNRVVAPQGVNSYLVLKAHFDQDIILSVRQRGLGGPSIRYSSTLETPASYRLRGNVLLSKRPGNATLLQGKYDHNDARWYWREIEVQDRLYGPTKGVYLRGEVLDENRTLIWRFLYHDLGSFGYVAATRDRGATGVALYGYGRPGEYFDDVCVDAVSARSEDDETDSFVWDTANVPAGEYYIYAVISDRDNTLRQYSPGRITVRHEHPLAFLPTAPLPATR